MKSFYELFVNELKDIYGTENQYLTALLKMSLAANSRALKEAFVQHVEETRNHIKRLDQVFKELQENPAGSHSDAMEGLFKEATDVAKADYDVLVKDAALINCAQRNEHYQIALYGILKTFAKHLQLDNAAKLFAQTLQEEKNADAALTKIAEDYGINETALRRSA